MGKAVKVVVGIGLAIFAPVLAPMIVGAGAGVFITGLATVGISLVGASLLGSAYSYDAPDVPDIANYSGQKIQTRKSNTAAVPIVYGTNKMGGNIIYQTADAWTGAGDSTLNGFNRNYWSINVLANHYVDEPVSVFSNEDEMTKLVVPAIPAWETEYVGVYFQYSGSSGMSTQEAIYYKLSSYGVHGAAQPDTFDQVVLEWSGQVKEQVYIEFDCALDGSFTYVGTGDSQELEDGASAASCHYHEYSEYDQDYDATINVTPADYADFQNNSGRNNLLDLFDMTGGGSLNEEFTLIQRPSFENSYRAVVRIRSNLYIAGSGAAVTYSFKARFREVGGGGFGYIPPHCSFLAVYQRFDGEENKNTQLVNITATIGGKTNRSIGSSLILPATTTGNNNPVRILLDLLRESLFIRDSEIDLPSWSNAQSIANANGFECNMALINQSNTQSIIQDILSTFRGQLTYTNGKWKVKADTSDQGFYKTVYDNDIINESLQMSMIGSRDTANKIIVKYVNPDDEWLTAQVEAFDGDLLLYDDQVLEKILQVKGVTNKIQAEKLAEITLNTMRYSEDGTQSRLKQTPLHISFATTVKNAEFEVGDIIRLDVDILDRPRKFMILSLETDQGGNIKVACREYAQTHYKDSQGNYLI